MKSSVTQRFKTFVNKHSDAMTIVGALIVFVTFVVKEAIGDNLREYVQSLHEAQSVFVLRQDHSVLEREVRGLRQEVQALRPAVQQQDRQKLQFVRESQDFEQSEKDYIAAGGSFIALLRLITDAPHNGTETRLLAISQNMERIDADAQKISSLFQSEGSFLERGDMVEAKMLAQQVDDQLVPFGVETKSLLEVIDSFSKDQFKEVEKKTEELETLSATTAFVTLRYDNMTSVVKKILRGYQRVETDRIIAFRSHWGYRREYCNPASGHEKGGVEGELGWFRRNWLVPVPEASVLDALNQHILDACLENRSRTILGRGMTIGQASELEREHLSPLAEEGFPIDELLYPLLVDSKGRVKVKTNWYSSPLWPGLRVTAMVAPLSVEIVHDNKVAARHARCYGRGHPILDLEHYLDVLDKKPGAMAGSTPLQQWRQAGRWPACLDAIWRELEQRHGKGNGTREMISLIRAGSIDGWDKLIAAVKEALRLGISDAAAVLHLLRMPDPEQRHQYAVALAEELLPFERPMPVMDEYDLLLANTTGGIQ